MARGATFTGFEPYKLTGVRVTDRVLGHGSYATVLEVEFMRLKCAGKKIHELLLEQGDASYTVRRFEEECRLLSQVRHPNLVQFLGIHFQQGERVPILVMEFLPTNLTSCIEEYGILPKEISYSILHDVALGLCYLHSQAPPIIHRDLSANNVLLTPNMTAKISDLGVARILDLTPLQVSRMTQTPGTPAYMPPEVMIAKPRYDTSVDEFSYGILMIHMFSGRWPEPQVGPNRIEEDRLIPVTEAERREVFLQSIGNDHPLMDLILRCINNNPRHRAHANESVERLAAMTLQFPVSFSMTTHIKTQLTTQNEEYEIQLAQERELCRRLTIESHESKSKINSLEYKISMLEADIIRKDAIITRKDSDLNAKTKTLKEKDVIISGLSEQLTGTREHLSSKQQVLHARITWKQCADLPTGLCGEKTTVINGKVYCGGGEGACNDDYYIVYCYDSLQDNWTTLPSLPVWYFGLGQLNGKLVAVGGKKKSTGDTTNEVYTYDEQSKKWKQTIPPMPTARESVSVLSLQSALVVVGGDLAVDVYTDAVEIFKADTSQWYRTDPLPIACYNICITATNGTCYALGGYNGLHLNQALYTSVDALLCNAVPANQITHSGSSNTQSAWKTFVNTLTYRPAVAVLAGSLLVLGGDETPNGGNDMKEVYMYSPSTNSWVYTSDLPAPRSVTAADILSSTEILVMGGWCDDRVNSVYKGTLELKL